MSNHHGLYYCWIERMKYYQCIKNTTYSAASEVVDQISALPANLSECNTQREEWKHCISRSTQETMLDEQK
ncbi:hypothetical protein PROFUN_11404 [Planoprotostelium fungivorum]|uniref:Uncharacterized protein n=1 Tax=Planoprotostelium fungivorum TaxID=1890364 RepID=A0A2P6NA85_9EUKA|nr:hypothetical protein PROFUN_11404 [Planoprotostelium fungivorum]